MSEAQETQARIIEHIGDLSHEELTEVLTALTLAIFVDGDPQVARNTYCLDGTGFDLDEPDDFRLTPEVWDAIVDKHGEIAQGWVDDDYIFDIVQDEWRRIIDDPQPTLFIDLN